MSYDIFTPDVSNEITYWMNEVRRWKGLINEKDSEIAKLRYVCDIRYSTIQEAIKLIDDPKYDTNIYLIRDIISRGIQNDSFKS